MAQVAKASKPTRRTEPKEVRRQQLIDAAIEAIAKYGIGGATMSVVTEEAGLSLGIVNFHFDSKQKLFEETLLYLAKEHNAHWERALENAELSANKKLQAIVDAHFDRSICSRKKVAVWYAFFGEGRRRAVYRDLIDDLDQERLTVSTQLCEEIIKEGGYTGISTADNIAQTLEALYDGLYLDILMYHSASAAGAARKRVHAYLHTVFPKHFEMPDFDS